MVNSIEMNNPGDVDGANPGESSDQLMAVYGAYVAKSTKELVIQYFWGEHMKTMDIVGIEGAEIWDEAALMRYKSRRAFVEIATHPDMQDRHKFRLLP